MTTLVYSSGRTYKKLKCSKIQDPSLELFLEHLLAWLFFILKLSILLKMVGWVGGGDYFFYHYNGAKKGVVLCDFIFHKVSIKACLEREKQRRSKPWENKRKWKQMYEKKQALRKWKQDSSAHLRLFEEKINEWGTNEETIWRVMWCSRIWTLYVYAWFI